MYTPLTSERRPLSLVNASQSVLGKLVPYCPVFSSWDLVATNFNHRGKKVGSVVGRAKSSGGECQFFLRKASGVMNKNGAVTQQAQCILCRRCIRSALHVVPWPHAHAPSAAQDSYIVVDEKSQPSTGASSSPINRLSSFRSDPERV